MMTDKFLDGSAQFLRNAEKMALNQDCLKRLPWLPSAVLIRVLFILFENREPILF